MLKYLFRLFLIGLFAYPAYSEDVPATSFTSLGFTPDLLFNLIQSSQKKDGEVSNGPLAGTLYISSAADFQEGMLGIGGSSFNFEMLYQYRRYLRQDCTGLFAGLYSSLSWQRGMIDFKSDGTLSIPASTGTTFHSAGLRLGGNIGWRASFGGWALSPRVGLVLPLLYNFGYDGLYDEQVNRLYFANALLRAVDFCLVLEILTTSTVQKN